METFKKRLDQSILWSTRPTEYQAGTYAYDDKVQTGPHGREVSPESEGDPLEQHLDREEDGEHQVHDLEDEHQLLVVLERNKHRTLKRQLISTRSIIKCAYSRPLGHGTYSRRSLTLPFQPQPPL